MRFTRLLVVAWCAALLCASLGGALPTYGGKARKVGDKPFRCIYDQVQREDNISLQDRPHVAIAPARSPLQNALGADAARAQADDWQPIRVRVFAEDLNTPGKYCSAVGGSAPDFKGGFSICQEADILTSEKKSMLLEEILPAAIALHQKRLSVKPTSGAIKVQALLGFCSKFSVPAAHRSTGVSDADFVLYVAAVPIIVEDVAAWGMTCQTDSDGRPVVGVINVSPRYFSVNPPEIHAVAHELLHALGFDYTLFQKLGLVSSISVRNKPASQVMNSPTVVAKAREHYGCDTLSYMELEDQDAQIDGKSHWKRRNAKDEMMTGVEGIGYYTPITIAAMEDTGFYKGNYDNAELMPWGYKAGCKLLNEKCVINGISQEPTMFCNDTTGRDFCTSDRLSIGYCRIETLSQNLPTYYQYFPEATEGGTAPYMDYCPIVESYTNAQCIDGDLSVMPGSVTGSNARCFDASSNTAADGTTDIYAICANVRCGTDTSSYQVKVKGAADYVTCTEGMVIQLKDVSKVFTSGAITCPSRLEVCRIDQPADASSNSATAVSSSSQPQPIASSSSTQPLSISSATAASSSSQPQPIASSSSSHPVSSSGATAASSSSQPQPIASSSSSHALSSSSATTASSSELSSSSSSIPTSSPTVNPTVLPPDHSVHQQNQNTIILTFVVFFLTLLL